MTYPVVMTSIGRNDPCPCGSGRKHKHCCLRAGSVVDMSGRPFDESGEAASAKPWRRMREAEGRLIPRMLELGVRTWRQEGMDEAYSVFFSDTPVPDDILTHPEHESLFLTWFALRFAPRPGRRRRNAAVPRPAALMLLEQARDLSDFERQYVTEAANRPVSFHVVTAVEPGQSMDLEDILTGATCRVIERTASTTVRTGGVLYARTVTMDGESIMLGCGAALLKPSRRSDVSDLRRQLAGGRAHLSERAVFEFDDILRRWYLLAADRELNPPLPKLTNTDGDPLAPTTMHFVLRCAPEEACAALRPLHAGDVDDDALLDDSERDEAGRLTGFSLDWTKAGNRVHKDWDNTILGHIEVRGDALTARVNSNRRAARLRREIEKRLGRRVTFVRAVIDSIETLMKRARESVRDGQEAQRREPEAAVDPEILAEFMERHWENWLDERIPALKNKTPRQAAKTAPGRERLEALLTEFEWRGGAPVERLRAALKL
jgi:hypothetical protein